MKINDILKIAVWFLGVLHWGGLDEHDGPFQLSIFYNSLILWF